MAASTYVGVGEVGLLCQVQDTDVVLRCPGAVLGVEVDGGDGDVPLARVLLVQVVVTHSDGQSAGVLSEYKQGRD